MITVDPNKICYIFDVDGTLTKPRKQMKYNFARELGLWLEDKQCIVATGSDYKKTKERFLLLFHLPMLLAVFIWAMH